MIEENKQYDDKIGGSQNKTNVNMVSEVDIPQVVKNENIEAKFIEKFENHAVPIITTCSNDSQILENQTNQNQIVKKLTYQILLEILLKKSMFSENHQKIIRIRKILTN